MNVISITVIAYVVKAVVLVIIAGHYETGNNAPRTRHTAGHQPTERSSKANPPTIDTVVHDPSCTRRPSVDVPRPRVEERTDAEGGRHK